MCKHKTCVNPDHLALETHAVNMSHKVRDGTNCYGEKNHNAKMTDQQVRDIRASKGTGTVKERAARFGVTPRMVSLLDNGRTWKHLQ